LASSSSSFNPRASASSSDDHVSDLADHVTVVKNDGIVGAGRVDDMTKDEVLGMIILGKCPAARFRPGSDG
jgi:hypothetical protein